jgi:hypothetical protein
VTTVPRVITRPTPAEWRMAFQLVYYEQTRHASTDGAFSVCWAQWALETARGSRCMNFNIGNIMPGGRWAGDTVLLQTWEMIAGKRVDMTEAFRAYPSLVAGMRDYIAFLRRPSYVRAWAAIEAGDAGLFGHVLKLLGYYTAPEADYVGGLRALAAEALRGVGPARPTLVVLSEAEQAEHDAAEQAAGESLPWASYDPATLGDHLVVPSTCHDVPMAAV